MNNRIVLCIGIGLIMFLTVTPLDNAVATVTGDIEINPEEPWPGGDVTFTVDIESDKDVDEVRLIVRECKESICFSDSFNETMDPVSSYRYQRSIKLRHDEAKYIEYQVKVKTSDGWFYIPGPGRNDYVKKVLTSQPEPDDGGNNTNGGDHKPDNGKTIGFELMLVLSALVIVILLNRKRDRIK